MLAPQVKSSFTETKDLLLCSQSPGIDPYTEPNKCIQQPSTLFYGALIKKFLFFYGTRRFIAVLTAGHLCVDSRNSSPIYIIIIIIIIITVVIISCAASGCCMQRIENIEPKLK
jgi:hypothetical protein